MSISVEEIKTEMTSRNYYPETEPDYGGTGDGQIIEKKSIISPAKIILAVAGLLFLALFPAEESSENQGVQNATNSTISTD